MLAEKLFEIRSIGLAVSLKTIEMGGFTQWAWLLINLRALRAHRITPSRNPGSATVLFFLSLHGVESMWSHDALSCVYMSHFTFYLADNLQDKK